MWCDPCRRGISGTSTRKSEKVKQAVSDKAGNALDINIVVINLTSL